MKVMIHKGAIEMVLDSSGFLSTTFLVHNKYGEFKPVINLRSFNFFVTDGGHPSPTGPPPGQGLVYPPGLEICLLDGTHSLGQKVLPPLSMAVPYVSVHLPPLWPQLGFMVFHRIHEAGHSLFQVTRILVHNLP